MIGAEARIAAGASVNGVAPVSVLGRFDATFPKSGPFTIQMSGSVSVLLIDLAQGRFRFISDGYADFSGQVGLDLEVFSLKGAVDGFIDGTNGSWGTSANVELCVDLEIGPFEFPCVSGEFAMSAVGMAACASAKLPEPVGRVSGGWSCPGGRLRRRAGEPDRRCKDDRNASAYAVQHRRVPEDRTGERSAGRRSRDRERAAGLPTATIALTGSGGAPDVDVAGPGGAALPAGSYIAKGPRMSTTYVVLNRPQAGAWTFTPRAGSPAITDVAQSDGYVPARVTARLRREGPRQAIAYSISNGTGQKVSFAEDGAFGTHLIGSAKGTKARCASRRPRGAAGGAPSTRSSRTTASSLRAKPSAASSRRARRGPIPAGRPRPAARQHGDDQLGRGDERAALRGPGAREPRPAPHVLHARPSGPPDAPRAGGQDLGIRDRRLAASAAAGRRPARAPADGQGGPADRPPPRAAPPRLAGRRRPIDSDGAGPAALAGQFVRPLSLRYSAATCFGVFLSSSTRALSSCMTAAVRPFVVLSTAVLKSAPAAWTLSSRMTSVEL